MLVVMEQWFLEITLWILEKILVKFHYNCSPWSVCKALKHRTRNHLFPLDSMIFSSSSCACRWRVNYKLCNENKWLEKCQHWLMQMDTAWMLAWHTCTEELHYTLVWLINSDILRDDFGCLVVVFGFFVCVLFFVFVFVFLLCGVLSWWCFTFSIREEKQVSQRGEVGAVRWEGDQSEERRYWLWTQLECWHYIPVCKNWQYVVGN